MQNHVFVFEYTFQARSRYNRRYRDIFQRKYLSTARGDVRDYEKTNWFRFPRLPNGRAFPPIIRLPKNKPERVFCPRTELTHSPLFAGVHSAGKNIKIVNRNGHCRRGGVNMRLYYVGTRERTRKTVRDPGRVPFLRVVNLEWGGGGACTTGTRPWFVGPTK